MRLEAHCHNPGTGDADIVNVELEYAFGYMDFSLPDSGIRFRIDPMELDSKWFRVKHAAISKETFGAK